MGKKDNYFAKTCILLVVSENQMDINGISAELEFFNLDEKEIQEDALSKKLKILEDQSLLTVEDGLYDITDKGMERLEVCVEQQRDMLDKIESLVNRYDRAFLA